MRRERELDDAISILDILIRESDRPCPQAEIVLQTMHWMRDNPDGKRIGRFIAIMTSRFDQMAAKVRDGKP